MKKYSKQRELIIQNLTTRADHPTAEELLAELKMEMPEIGMATVYRNLSELCEEGTVRKLKAKVGADRFDGISKPHIHFECTACGKIENAMPYNNEFESLEDEMKLIEKKVKGKIEKVNLSFEGICDECKAKTKSEENIEEKKTEKKTVKKEEKKKEPEKKKTTTKKVTTTAKKTTAKTAKKTTKKTTKK